MNLIKNKYTYFTIVIILLIITVNIFFKKPVHKYTEESSTIDLSQPMPEFKFIIKEYNGKIAVFEIDKEKPSMIFDVKVNTLPDFDIEQLKQGLKIKDEEELNQRIEDFIS